MSNDFAIDAGLTLRVQAWAQPDEATALRRYEMVRDLLVARRGNVSVWRVQRPSTGTWVVVICGRPENMVELEGEPHQFTDEEASAFVARRLMRRGLGPRPRCRRRDAGRHLPRRRGGDHRRRRHRPRQPQGGLT